MTTFRLGETIAYQFTCTNSAGATFDPDVVQVSFVKDHATDVPPSSLYEDTLTYGGSEERDAQLVRVSQGVYSFSYTADRIGRWSILPRWTDADLPAGGMVTSRSEILFDVVATEHQFIDREAMIPPSGGEPISVPYATDTTGGMLTDAMAVKFAALPADAVDAAEVSDAIADALADYSTTTAMNTAIGDAISGIPDATASAKGLATAAQITKLDTLPSDSQSAAQVLATLSSSAVRTYYETNWSRQAWYLDAVNGDDSATGYEEAHPLQTVEELTARLAVPIPIDHPVTVYVAQGSYGTLAVNVVQTALACPFDVVGAVAHTSIGTVTSYSTPAYNSGAHLVASGVSDWAADVGKRVDVLDGASSGAIAWTLKANPQSLGATVARVARFGSAPVASTGKSTRPSPTPGSAVSLATLPTFQGLYIQRSGPHPATGAVLASMGVRVYNIDVPDVVCLSNAQPLFDGCRLSSMVFGMPTTSGAANQLAQEAMLSRCLIVPRGADTTVALSSVHLYNSGVLVAGTVQLTDCGSLYTTYQGCAVYPVRCYSVFDGVFDSPSGFPGIYIQPTPGMSTIVTGAFGQGNATAGIYVPPSGYAACTSCTVTGVSGDIYLAGRSAYIPWSALPWVDGARSGEATLAVPGTGHDAESTSYVDVTVPYVLSTQKIVASYKTFGGTTGSVLAKYIDATTIRVVSSSATDTSVVTWHILPTGDNAVIRS